MRLNHNYIGTEYLLLGLIREGEGVAATVLANLGVELSAARGRVEFIVGRGERPPQGEISFSPRAKTVLMLAMDESRRLGHHFVGTEHLLLGVIHEGEGIAAGTLESLGMNLEKVRTEVIKVFSGPIASSTSPQSHTLQPSAPSLTYAFLYTRWKDEEPAVVRAEGVPIPGGVSLHGVLDELGRAGWQLAGIDSKGDGESLYVLHRPRLER